MLVSILPPIDIKYCASAFATWLDPPFGMGQPFKCAVAIKTRAYADVALLVKGCIEWAAIPARRPLASSVLKRFDKCAADVSAFSPKRAIAKGCFGKCSGAKTSEAILGQSCTMGCIKST